MKTPHRHLPQSNNKYVLCDDYAKNHLADWFLSVGNWNKYGWLSQHGCSPSQDNTGDATETRREFTRTISHINNGNEDLADFGSGPWILGRH